MSACALWEAIEEVQSQLQRAYDSLDEHAKAGLAGVVHLAQCQTLDRLIDAVLDNQQSLIEIVRVMGISRAEFEEFGYKLDKTIDELDHGQGG